MRVMKFGGSSIADSGRIRSIIEIVIKENQRSPVLAVVVSAFGGTTDLLLKAGRGALQKDEGYLKILNHLKEKHFAIIETLISPESNSLIEEVDHRFSELSAVLKGIFLIGELTGRSRDLLMSFGERLSAFIIAAAMNQVGIDARFLDARNIIVTDGSFGGAQVLREKTDTQIRNYFEQNADLQIVTGFIAATTDGETTTLGRGGSDYTAAILSAALSVEKLEIWTDVDGVLTADPRRVLRAFPISEMTYEEAMELSHFGARVIYPPTMQPVREKQIPIVIRNSFNRSFAGTIIHNMDGDREEGVKGISSISGISLLTLQGSGLIGVKGTAERLFRSLSSASINILLITQASSEHSICIGVLPARGAAAKNAIETEFQLEIAKGWVDPVLLEENLAAVAAVGDGMRQIPGIAGRFFQAMGAQSVNVKAIAQGSSERNISVVVDKGDESRALNALHNAFFEPREEYRLFLAGTGGVGIEFLKQLKGVQQHSDRKGTPSFALCGVINSRSQLLENDLDPRTVVARLDERGETADIEVWREHILERLPGKSILIDCTASQEITDSYLTMMNSGVSVVAANKRACSGPYPVYQQLEETAAAGIARFRYETNVGAGLPVLNTMKDMIRTGDKITAIEGVLSGTLSFIFNRLSTGQSFSDVVHQAYQEGYTEPDPRDDLNGLDVARKLLILCRTAGAELELTDIPTENLVPESCHEAGSVEDFLDKLHSTESPLDGRVRRLARKGVKLVYGASYINRTAQVGLMEVDEAHPFYHLQGTDNIILIRSEHYAQQPMVIRGPGAGTGVTAAGVLADVLQIVQPW